MCPFIRIFFLISMVKIIANKINFKQASPYSLVTEKPILTIGFVEQERNPVSSPCYRRMIANARPCIEKSKNPSFPFCPATNTDGQTGQY